MRRMQPIEIDVRIALRRLTIVKHNDADIAGAADEPFLWFAGIKVDASSVNPMRPNEASVTIHAASGKHHNLGGAAEGVTDGDRVPIPESIGTWETTLRGFDSPLGLTQFATLGFAVAALEHDESSDVDAIEVWRRVVADAQTRLDTALRGVIRDGLDAIAAGTDLPSESDVQAQLEAAVSYERIDEVVDDFSNGRIGAQVLSSVFNPISLVQSGLEGGNPDDFIGHTVQTATFAMILATSMTGIRYDLELTRKKDAEVTLQGGGADLTTHGRATYRVAGSLKRLDIQEPPTIGLVRFHDGRLRIYGRSVNKNIYYHERTASGQWRPNTRVGSGEFSSGPAVAASADGASIYTFARGMSHRIWLDVAGGTDAWRKLGDRKFATGAGAACSNDGRIVWVAATGDDHRIYLQVSTTGKFGLDDDWRALDIGESATSPALACTGDGTVLHLAYVGADRNLRRARFELDRGSGHEPVYVKTHGGGFRSAPALAVSDGGSVLWIAALGDDDEVQRRQRLRRVPTSPFFESRWMRFQGASASAPSLACTPDGKGVHLADIAHSLRLRHRASNNEGESWPQRELLSPNALWF
jgi:hypothetical protein